MIEIVEGRLGGGKSYMAVTRMLPIWAKGGTVVANIPLHWDRIKQHVADEYGVILLDEQYIELIDDQIPNFYKYIPTGTHDCPVQIVLDEAHTHFNAREWKENHERSKATFKWLTHSRHYHTDVLFISQSKKNIDAQIGRLCQWCVTVRDLEKFTISVWIGNFLPLPPFFLRTYLDYQTGDSIKQEWVRKDKRIYNLYDSFCELAGVSKDRVVTRKQLEKTKKKPNMKRWAILIAVIVCGGVWAVHNFVNNSKIGAAIAGKRKQETQEKVAAAPNQPALAQTSAAVPTVEQSIFTERVALDVPGELWTDEDHYKVGRLCNRGYVEAIRDREVRIRKMDGSGFLFVRAIDTPPPKKEKEQSPEITIPQKQIVIAATMPEQPRFSTPPMFPGLTAGRSENGEQQSLTSP